jgi:hypothetical protein
VVAAITFVYLFFVSAPYGRHIRKGWGRNISARAGWVIMESPCVVIMSFYAFIVRDNLETYTYNFFIALDAALHSQIIYLSICH